jgi:minor histocompatibility antigen H13
VFGRYAVPYSPRMNLKKFRSSKSLVLMARFSLGSSRWKQFQNFRFLIKKGPKGALSHILPTSHATNSVVWTEILSFSLKTPSLLLFPLGALPSALYTFPFSSRKSVLLTDILSLSFSHNALSILKLDSFRTGFILLSGLFFYDIWWVFGTDVVSSSR